MAGNKAKPPEVWDRQAKESLRAFKCFCVYRDMPYKDADNITRKQIERGRSARAVAKETLEVRQIGWSGDYQHFSDVGKHQGGKRIVDHRLVVYRQKLL